MHTLSVAQAAALVACVTLTIVDSLQARAARQQPTFRTGTDVVRLDVSVFDTNHQLVRGLTADEFTILENGRPQQIVAFQPVVLSSAADGLARWQRSYGPDVQSNEAEDRRTRSSIPAPLEVTLANGLPVRGIPLRLQATGFAGTDQAPGTVAVVTGIRVPGGKGDPDRSPLPIDVVATIFNERWQQVQTSRQTLAVSDGADVRGWFELVERFAVPPGRYEVRVAAQRGDETGSVFVDLDVPDAGKPPLSMSGITLAQHSSEGTITPHVLADLLPRAPTATREFRSTDHVSAFVRLYQGDRDPPVAVTVAALAVDDRDRTVWDTTTTMGGDAFATARTALYSVEVPLARLMPGPHLLTIRAMIGTRIVQKQVLFRIVN